MKRRISALLRDERGHNAVGTLYMVPVILLLLATFYYVGVTAQGENIVRSAANAAARDASLARDAYTAQAAAQDAAARVLNQGGINCKSQTVTIDASELNTAVGQTGVVTASVTCDLNLVDLGVSELTQRQVTATGMSPVDKYRQR